jgi:hypothetical protein
MISCHHSYAYNFQYERILSLRRANVQQSPGPQHVCHNLLLMIYNKTYFNLKTILKQVFK